MGLFVNKPLPSSSKLFYTVSQTKTVLIVGLGNIGKEYTNTRHNVGFMCVDKFVDKNDQLANWIEKKDLKGLFSIGQMGDSRVIIIKPTTFMNLSGEAVQATADFYKISPEDTLVVHDELDIDFGHIRTRKDGASAGNNGIQSIIDHLGENFNRVRIGIGPKDPKQIASDKFVLSQFDKTETTHLDELTNEVCSIITEFVFSGQLNHETRSFLS